MSDIQEEQKRLYKRAEENDYGDLLRKYNNLKTTLDESQEVVISYKEENTRLNNIIDEAIKYNKELCELYDLGSMERSNADTNLIILQDKEHLEILKEINELKGDNK